MPTIILKKKSKLADVAYALGLPTNMVNVPNSAAISFGKLNIRMKRIVVKIVAAIMAPETDMTIEKKAYNRKPKRTYTKTAKWYVAHGTSEQALSALKQLSFDELLLQMEGNKAFSKGVKKLLAPVQ